jgi:long-chain acyl-CoA synthetase
LKINEEIQRTIMANYYQRFLECVAKWPDKAAVELQHASGSSDAYTYAELRQMSDAVAAWITCSGTAAGERCVILAANTPRWVAVFMGTLAAGCIAVPLDSAFNSDQVRKLILDSGARLLFVDEKHAAVAQTASDGLPVSIVLIDGKSDQHTSVDPILAAAGAPHSSTSEKWAFEDKAQSGDVAAILYSSGTTGDPKGVMLTHGNLHAETDGILRAFALGPTDSILAILPLFHALALVVNLLLPLAAGCRILFLDSLNTADLMRALPRVNIFICVPQFFYLIHERLWKEVGARGPLAQKAFRAMLLISRFGRIFGLNLGKVFFGKIHKLMGENMRLLGSGGSKLDAEIGREFEDLGFLMLQGYGLTETTGCAMYTPPGRVDIATIGVPLPGMEVRIVPKELPQPPTNAATTQSHAGPQEGEICIRGGIVMKGYWNRPDATAAVLDSDGWLHTGDLGFMDDRGFVRITGRAKEIIVTSSGKNIYPDEIEKHYLQSPYIKELCVLGLESAPGEPFSERLYGVVVPNFDLMKQQKIVNAREILRYEIENLSTKLPSQKRILSYEIWQEDLPRTTTRKIKRFEIERRVRERQAAGGANGAGEIAPIRKLTAEDERWLSDPDAQRAMAVVRDASKAKKDGIHPDDNLELDLGLDSMERVELLVALEREFATHVEEGVISEVYSVRELITAVQRARAAGGLAAERPAWDTVLHQEPDDPDVLNVAKPHGIETRILYLLTRFAQLIARDLFHLRVEGIENLPADGPFILAPNHQSFLDGPIVMGAVPWRVFRRVFYVGTSDIFGQGLWRRIARSLRLIPVDPDANLVPAMRAGAFGLRNGNVLVLFPEGERSIDGTPKNFKKGAAILATHLKVPIVPVALDGFYEAWPRKGKFNFGRFAPLRVRFGKPVLTALNGDSPEGAYDNATRELRNRVLDMWEELHAELYPEAEAVGKK